MKKSLFMYLFFFAVLFILFQYMNQRSIFENQESQIRNLDNKLEKATDSITILSDRVDDLNYFTLQGNENAMTYLENYGLDAAKVEAMVTDKIYDQNGGEKGNPIIPFEGERGGLRVNKIKFLNHRWILADFSDGATWGEMIIEYQFDKDNNLDLFSKGALLYPN